MFVRDRQHGPETLQVYVLRADLVMVWQPETTRGAYRLLRIFAGDFQERGLRGFRPVVDQIHDHALVLANYSGVRFGDEIADRRRAPMISARHPATIIQALLHDGPLAIRRDDK